MEGFDKLIEDAKEYKPQEEGQDGGITDLERSVLTGLLDQTLRVKYLSQLDRWDFSITGAGILDLIKSLDRDGITIDLLTLNEKKGDLDLDLSDYFLPTSPIADREMGGYVRLLREKGKKRFFLGQLQRIWERVQRSDGADFGSLQGELQKIVYDLDLSRKLGSELRSETHYRKNFYDLLISRGTKELIGLNTGFKNMNFLLQGLQDGLVVIAGVTGTGKTTFSNQLANQVVAGNKEVFCLYYSLEMSREDLEFMTYSRLSGIGLSDLKKGLSDKDKEVEDKIDKIGHANETYGSYCDRLYILDRRVCPSPTVDSIRGDYNRVRVESKLEKCLIVIDYLQIFDLGKEDRRLTIDKLLTDLKNLSIEISCPIVVVSSVSRGSYGKKGEGVIGLDVFKESGNIEFSADVAITMTTPPEGKGMLSLPEGGKTEEIWLSGVKNRWGSKGKMILFEFDPTYASFKERINKGGTILDIPKEDKKK